MNKNLIDNELKWKLDRIVPVKALRHTLRKKLKKKKKKITLVHLSAFTVQSWFGP